MSYSKSEINKLIATLPKGKSSAINAPDLAMKLGYSSLPNQEELRAVIRFAIDSGFLIGSGKSGYWLIDSIEEINEVLDSLESRAQGVCDRRNKLLESWNNSNPKKQSVKLHLNLKP
ncbi:hypothetical protein [Chryseobacterium sp.]|uniref:hypothetical protein n=1 Tax=Chryseobacterium sp. TaxID=1871047 RepID=UPI0035C6FAA4